MTAQSLFHGRNIVVTLVVILIYLIYSSLQTPDSSLSKLVTLRPALAPTITPTGGEEIVPSVKSVKGVNAQRQLAQVTKVVDGDTIDVLLNGTKEKIRIIGLNTPETVDPRRGVQCFGREASNFAKQTLTGKSVYLESDPTQSDRDKYGRLLRFVFLKDGTDFGKLLIQEGYGHEYTYDIPYKYQSEYKKAQQQAQKNKKGLWAENVCP